jgi:GntR family transcriptional regulator / MocR family aminotransferase
MTSLLIRPDGRGPLYSQIYRAIRSCILSGRLAPGARLPPTRLLARELGASRNVVVIAYEQLVSEGYAESRVGSGTYVAAALPDLAPDAGGPVPAPRPVAGSAPRLSPFGRAALAVMSLDTIAGAAPVRPRLDFRYGRIAPDARGLALWHRMLARESRSLGSDYGDAAGDPGLRAAVSGYLQRSRGVHCTTEQVMIVTGSQQALDLTARVMLSSGDAVLIEEPQYRGARQAFLAAGARLVPAEVDAEGMDFTAVATSGARLAYVTPSHQFPTGAVMSLSRRLALLEWAREHDAYVVEDDYDSEFRYQGRPIEAVQGLDPYQRTIYVGTFSKVLSPALRIGYLVLPHPLVAPFRAAKWLSDRHSPLAEQGALARFIEEGHFEQHLRRMRQINARRRAAVLDAIGAHLSARVEVAGTNAGLHLLLWLPSLGREDTARVRALALAKDVGVYPVTDLYLRPPERAGLLIGYASLTEVEIREGIERLAEVIDSAAALTTERAPASVHG